MYRLLIFLGGIVIELHCLYSMWLILLHVSAPLYVSLCCSCHVSAFCIYRDVINLSSYISIRAGPGCHIFSPVFVSQFSFVSPSCCFHLPLRAVLGFPSLPSVSSAVFGIFCVVLLRFLFFPVGFRVTSYYSSICMFFFGIFLLFFTSPVSKLTIRVFSPYYEVSFSCLIE